MEAYLSDKPGLIVCQLLLYHNVGLYCCIFMNYQCGVPSLCMEVLQQIGIRWWSALAVSRRRSYLTLHNNYWRRYCGAAGRGGTRRRRGAGGGYRGDRYTMRTIYYRSFENKRIQTLKNIYFDGFSVKLVKLGCLGSNDQNFTLYYQLQQISKMSKSYLNNISRYLNYQKPKQKPFETKNAPGICIFIN